MAVLVSALVTAAPAAAITPTVTEYPTPTQPSMSLPNGSGPDGIAAGPDGNLWFAEYNANKIGRIPPNAAPGSSAQIDEFPVPANTSANPSPTSIARGPDGAMWFVEFNGGAVGRIPTNAMPGSSTGLSEFLTPAGVNSHPAGITAGSDGNLWFVEGVGNNVGKIAPNATSGSQIAEYSIPSGSAISWRIAAGPDGALWFTERSSGKVGRIPTSATTGNPQITEMAIPSGPGDGARGITAGPDGALWFADQYGNAIGRIPTTASPGNPQVTEYPLPHPSSGPVEIAAGLDGHLWFTEQNGARIGRIPTTATPGSAAQIEEFTIPSGSIATGIALGPDGNIWFTENAYSKVGRITTPPTATTGGTSSLSTTSATVAGAANGHAQNTSYHFDYGPQGGALTSTSETGTGQGGAVDDQVLVNLSGLAPATTYQYRIVVTNPTGTTAGSFMTFATAPIPAPIVTTLAAGGIGQSSAVLNGRVDPHGAAVAASFEYGTRADLLGATATAPQVVPTGLGAVAVSAPIAGLKSSTRYYFRIVATDTVTGARTAGAITSFVTSAPVKRIDSTMTWTFVSHRKYVTVASLLVAKAPAGARITVICSGPGCPYASRTISVSNTVTKKVCRRGRCKLQRVRRAFADVELSGPFRGHHVAYRSKIQVRITKRGWIGKIYIFRISGGIQPEIACLSPGSSRPGQGC